MKLVFLLVVLLFAISTVESQSKRKILKRCRFLYGYKLKCENFRHSHLPYVKKYKQVTHVEVEGRFDQLTLDRRFKKLEHLQLSSTNLRNVAMANYVKFTKLNDMRLTGSHQIVDVDFTGIENMKELNHIEFNHNKMLTYTCESLKLSNLEWLQLDYNNMDSFDFSCVPKTLKILYLHYNKIPNIDLQSCETLKTLTSLTDLNLDGNKLTDFNFACLPPNLQNLLLDANQISTISDESCEVLKVHTSLVWLALNINNLQQFQFGCLPASIENVFLSSNSITEINDLSNFPHSHQSSLRISLNPIRCTCPLLQDFIQLVEAGSIVGRIACGNVDSVDSELASYPWGNNATAIKLHDASALGCLTSDIGN